MTKEEILKKINEAQKIKGMNSMGVSESYYDPYFLTKACFTSEELQEMSQKELENIIKLANFASDIFY